MRILGVLTTGETLAALKPGELTQFERWRSRLGQGCDWPARCSAEALAVLERVDTLTRQGLIRQLNRGNLERLEVSTLRGIAEGTIVLPQFGATRRERLRQVMKN